MGNAYKKKSDLIHELERMQQKLLEVEECRVEYQAIRKKYEKLLDSAPDAMVFVDSEKTIVMTNAQFDTLFGYSHGEVIGKGLEVLIPEPFREKHHQLVADFFKDPRVRSMGSDLEIYALRKDGGEFPADISLSLLQTDDELLVSAAIRDITKRKQAEEQAELNFIIQRVLNSMLKISLEPIQLEKQLERILDLIISVPHLSLQSKGAIYVREDDPDVLVMRARRGFREDEAQPCLKIPFGECLCGKAAALSEMVFSDHVNNHHEIHHEGEFPHGHYCVPILSGSDVLGLINVYVKEGHKKRGGEEAFLSSVASTLAGIIRHNRTEHEKEHLQLQLAQTEKLAALGRFTANVAHEIRNPLTAVGGFARRLEKVIPGDSREKEYTLNIISEVSRLENILKKVLSYSHDVSPQMEAYDIHEILDRVLMLHREVCERKSISIHTLYDDSPRILVDPSQFHEAVENIVLNAIDAMPAGGDLTIATGRRIHEGIPYVSVIITDSGTGIPEERLDKIFEPFYTTKIAERGTGLGLSITKKVVEDHGGFIRVESEFGKGTVFTLFFPYKLQLQSAESAGAPAQEP